MNAFRALPDEALEQILRNVSLSIAHLWMAGDSLFNLRIVRCCKTVQTDSILKRSKISRWPRLFSQLTGLQTLNIEVDSFGERTDVISREVRKLPPTLTELSLRFELAQSIPLENLDYGMDGYGAINPFFNISQTQLPTYWSLKDLFPRLKKAAFAPFRATVQAPLFGACFDNLPDTLEDLTWTGLLKSTTNFSSLPRTLTSLDLEMAIGSHLSPETVQTLPPSLRYLKGISTRDVEVIRALPSTIRSVDCLHPFENFISSDMLDALPSGTQVLDVGAHIAKLKPDPSGLLPSTRWLPCGLTEIRMLNRLDYQMLTLFPKTITAIGRVDIDLKDVLRHISSGDGSLEACWPPNLTKLSLTGVGGIPEDSTVQLLPNSLEVLEISRVGLSLSIIPKTLTLLHTLEITSIDIITEEEALTLHRIPSTVTRLKISRILSSFFGALPPKLLELETFWTPGPISAYHLALLPPTLMVMKIQVKAQKIVSDYPPNERFSAPLQYLNWSEIRRL